MGSYKLFEFNIFFNLKFVYGFVFKVLNMVSFDKKQKYEHALHEKLSKFEQDNPKKLLDRYGSSLEFFSCNF